MMKTRGSRVLFLLVLALGLYAYFGEYKREIHENQENEKDLKVLTLKRDQIQKVTLDKGPLQIQMVKSPAGWDLTQPLQDECDHETVESFLDQAFGEKRVDTIKNSQNFNWAEYGLEPAMGTLTLENHLGETETLQVSLKKNFEGLVYLRRNSEAQILTSSLTWQSFLTKPLDGWRNLRLFRSSISKVQEITIRNSKAKSLNLKRVEGVWTSSERPDWKLDQNAVRELLTQVSLSKGQSLSNQRPQKRPDFEIEFKMEEEKWDAKFFFLNSSKSWLVSISKPNLLIQFPPETLEKVRKMDLVDMRDKASPFQFQRELVKKIRVKNPLKEVSLLKEKPEWKLEKEDSQFSVNSIVSQEMIEKSHRLQVYRYVEKPPQKIDFTSQVQFFDESGVLLFEMKWSDFKDHEAYMVTSLSSEVFQIDDAQINRLEIHNMVKSSDSTKEKKND